MIKSLDELVTDIEDTSAITTDQHSRIANNTTADESDRALMYQFEQKLQQQQQQQCSLSMSLVADVSRQLSENFDLHDSLIGITAL